MCISPRIVISPQAPYFRGGQLCSLDVQMCSVSELPLLRACLLGDSNEARQLRSVQRQASHLLSIFMTFWCNIASVPCNIAFKAQLARTSISDVIALHGRPRPIQGSKLLPHLGIMTSHELMLDMRSPSKKSQSLDTSNTGAVLVGSVSLAPPLVRD